MDSMFCLYLLCLLVSVLSSVSPDVIVDTHYGKIRGIQTTKTKSYFGIPYAQPPVGKLRWENPQDASSWSPNVYNATQLKPGCPQVDCARTLPPDVCPPVVSEDCLYLNVWTPIQANLSTSYPVYVFIHGGAFDGMSSSSPLFDAENITYKGEVITVTINYRLGALGFLVTEGTSKERGFAGNYGILDQRLALKWVHDNIKYFGGNPGQVTVGGQSAGAQSTVIHLMNKEVSQYFHKAIIQSEPFAIPFRSRDEALYLGSRLTEAVGCKKNDMDCLRQKTAVQIATAQASLRSKPTSLRLLEFFEPWGPYVDGDIVPTEPLVAIKNIAFFDKPVIIGTLTQETRIYVYTAWDKPVSASEYAELMFATFPSKVEEVLAQYPPSSSDDQRDTLVKISTDFMFTCGTRNYTRNILDKGNTNVYHYIFNHAFSFPGWGTFNCCNGYVCHGSDLPYLFQAIGNFTFTPSESVLSDSLLYYWTNFIKTGNPNLDHPVSLTWPSYQPSTNWNYLFFQTPKNIIGSHYQSDQCSFWDTIGYKA